MITKNVNIELTIRRIEYNNSSTMSLYFERPIGFQFESGDWIDVNFEGGNPEGGITYSFSSSPTEHELAITFKIGISPFKKRLQSLQPGDNAYISQYGNDYNFHLQEHRSSVLIAGGIGVAPFRSMIKEMYDTSNKNTVQLIYMNKGDSYIFSRELNMWQQKLPNINIQYIDTTNLNRKKRTKLLINLIDKNAHHYFIAGPKGMVESIEHLLIDDMSISTKDIRIDVFGGY